MEPQFNAMEAEVQSTGSMSNGDSLDRKHERLDDLPQSQPNSYNALLRTFGLQIFNLRILVTRNYENWWPWKLTVRRVEEEESKFVIQHDRRVAVLRALIHIPPLAGCIALITINSVTRYCGPFFVLSPVLQFVAKFHELLMQTSITACALAYIRNEMVLQGDIPFGAIFSALQLTSISSLWSMEFWSSVLSFDGRRRLLFMLLVPFCVLLVGAVGPSAAISIVPRPTDYHVATSTHFLEPQLYNEIFPDRLSAEGLSPRCSNTMIAVGNDNMTSCLSSDWMSLLLFLGQCYSIYSNDEPNSDILALPDLSSPRVLNVSSPGTNSKYSTRSTETTASLQPWLIASYMQESILRWWYMYHSLNDSNGGDTQLIVNLATRQAQVSASCKYFYAEPNDTALISIGDFESEDLTYARVAELWAEHPLGEIVWRDAELKGKGKHSLYALILLPQKEWTQPLINMGYINANATGGFNAICTIDSTWSPTIMTLTSKNSAIGSVMTSKSLTGISAGTDILPISTAWANLALPSFRIATESADYSSLREVLLHHSEPESLVYSHSDFSNLRGSNVEVTGWNLERMLSSFFAAGMTRGLQNNVSQRLTTDTSKFTFARSGWSDSDSLNYFRFPEPSKSNPIPLRSDFYVRGQAYTLEGFPIKLAISVLLVYCLLAIGAIVHAFIAGNSSTSWDSIAELTALALNSERPKTIHNISAGIERIGTFRRLVSIKARKGAGVQIVFNEDEKDVESNDMMEEGNEPFENVKVNQKY